MYTGLTAITTTMRTKTKILIALGCIILGGMAVFGGLYFTNTQSKASESTLIEVEVASGSSLNQVIDSLEAKGVLKSAFFTKVQARLQGAPEVKAGTFVFDAAWNSQEVLDFLNDPYYLNEGVDVQLLEGGWAKDFAKVLSENFDIPAQTFLDTWNDREYIATLMEKYDVLPQTLLDHTDTRVLLEGYLYPDTYNFSRDSDVKAITERILDNTQAKLSLYLTDLDFRLDAYDLMTLASIVEYEASSDEDMRMIAGVFFNRIDIDMKLESSVTTCYALYDFESWEECEANPTYDSPYNTYVYTGLPPGPILNPSARAVEAVLNYTESDYYFFLADVYGDGRVYYQSTYAEHEVLRKQLLGY